MSRTGKHGQGGSRTAGVESRRFGSGRLSEFGTGRQPHSVHGMMNIPIRVRNGFQGLEQARVIIIILIVGAVEVKKGLRGLQSGLFLLGESG